MPSVRILSPLTGDEIRLDIYPVLREKILAINAGNYRRFRPGIAVMILVSLVHAEDPPERDICCSSMTSAKPGGEDDHENEAGWSADRHAAGTPSRSRFFAYPSGGIHCGIEFTSSCDRFCRTFVCGR